MNIILITVDCFRYDRCEFNGYYRNTTPVLSSLAQESYIFDYAYSTGPYTTESVPGIIAGQHSYNGVYFGRDSAWKAIPPNSTTIASHLSEHGYNTLAVLTNPHLTTARNFDQGFDFFDNLRTKGKDQADEDANTTDSSRPTAVDRLRERFKKSNRRYSPYVLPFIAYRYYQYRTDWPSINGEVVTEEFRSQLQSAHDPFLAWTHFMDLHAPITPKVTNKEGEELADGTGTLQHLYHTGNYSRDHQDPIYNQIYNAAVRYVDCQIGKIIETLQSTGQWEETILIVTGDHGEVINDRMGVHGHPRHHHYDELLRVPLLVRIPGFDGKRIQHPVSLAWIPSMVTSLLEVTQGDFPFGNDELVIFEPADDSNPPVVSDSLDAHGHTMSVRNRRHKLISHFADENTLETRYPYFSNDIAYKYRTDPTERHPVQTDSLQNLRAVIEEIATEKADVPNIRGRFSEAVEQRLKDLGYQME